MNRLAVFAMLALLAGCAATPADEARRAESEAKAQARLDKALAGLKPGKPTTCIQQVGLQRTESFGRTILFKFGPGRIYRNDTNGGCERIGQGDIMVARLTNAEYCRGDIITTHDQGTHMFTGTCALGDFVPYTKAGR